jgi:hypothetical protein
LSPLFVFLQQRQGRHLGQDADDDSTGNDKHEDQNSSSNTTTTASTNSEPKVTFQSVVFFTLQSFPEALRAVERNLVYNFGPLR